MHKPQNIKDERAPARRGRKLMIWLGGILAVLLILILIGVISEAAAEAADARAYPPPGELVDVGGYRLQLNCTGSGSPTVVIEAGMGDWSTGWGYVQPEVAKTTRVCTYDRAGLGWSEPGPLPRNASHIAKELHMLLQNANIPGPFILVGHSLGGLPVRVYVHEYPSEVAGVVLVDSMFPGQSKMARPSIVISSFPVLARVGLARLLARPLGLIEEATPNQKAYFANFVRPKSAKTVVDEIQGLPDSIAEAGSVTTFGDIPLIVLSAGIDQMKGWEEGQAELAKLSSNSQQMVAEKSDHTIAIHQPEAAVAAIVKMVELVRQSTQK
jgi:pimeloyl-ACP methyl ester carboxylesterase